MAIRSSVPMTFGEKAQEDFSVSHLQGEAAYRCGAHWHDCFELILVQKGIFTVILDGVPVELAAGDLAVIPPHLLHATAGEVGAYDVLVLGYTEELIYSPEISIANLKFLLPFRWARPAEQWRIPDPGGLRKRFLDAAAAASKSALQVGTIARIAELSRPPSEYFPLELMKSFCISMRSNAVCSGASTFLSCSDDGLLY